MRSDGLGQSVEADDATLVVGGEILSHLSRGLSLALYRRDNGVLEPCEEFQGFGDIASIVGKLTRFYMIKTSKIEPQAVSGVAFRRMDEREADLLRHDRN